MAYGLKTFDDNDDSDSVFYKSSGEAMDQDVRPRAYGISRPEPVAPTRAPEPVAPAKPKVRLLDLFEGRAPTPSLEAPAQADGKPKRRLLDLLDMGEAPAPAPAVPPKKDLLSQVSDVVDPAITKVFGENKPDKSQINEAGLAEYKAEQAQQQAEVAKRRLELGVDKDRGYAMKLFDSAASSFGGAMSDALEWFADTVGSESLKKLAEAGKIEAEALSPKDQDLLQKVAGGVGSTLSFFIPGTLAVKGARVLGAGVGAARTIGAGASAALESASIAQETYDKAMSETGDKDLANRQAWKAGAANLPLTWLTNRLGQFSVKGGATSQIGRAFLFEGGEEGLQQILTNTLGFKPIGQGVTESTVIGALSGGVLKGGTVAFNKFFEEQATPEQRDQIVKTLIEDGKAARQQVFDSMMQDERAAEILQANKIDSAEDPRFQGVAVQIGKLDRILSEFDIPTPEQREERRKGREEDIKAAFGDTASTAVGVGMGTPKEGVISRESVQTDEQNKTLVPVGAAPVPVQLPNSTGQSTPAVSGEDIVAAQQRLTPLRGYTLQNPDKQGRPFVFSNRFASEEAAQGQIEALRAGNLLEQQLSSGVIKNAGALKQARENYNALVQEVLGFPAITDWKAPLNPVFPDLTGLEISFRQGKQAKAEGGRQFWFAEARPIPFAQPAPRQKPTKPAEPAAENPATKPVNQPDSEAAAPQQSVPEEVTPESGTSVPNTGTEPAGATKAKRVSKGKKAPEPSPAPAAPAVGAPSASEAPSKSEKPATKKAKETSKKKEAKPKAEKPATKKASKKTEGPAFTAADLEETKRLVQELGLTEETNAAQEGKQPEGNKQQREGTGGRVQEGGREDRQRETEKPKARAEDSGRSRPPESQRVTDPKQVAQDLEKKRKLDRIKEKFSGFTAKVGELIKKDAAQGDLGRGDPAWTDLTNAANWFVDTVIDTFGGKNVAAVIGNVANGKKSLDQMFDEYRETGEVKGPKSSLAVDVEYRLVKRLDPAKIKSYEQQVKQLQKLYSYGVSEKVLNVFRQAKEAKILKRLAKEKGLSAETAPAALSELQARVTVGRNFSYEFLREAGFDGKIPREERNRMESGPDAKMKAGKISGNPDLPKQNFLREVWNGMAQKAGDAMSAARSEMPRSDWAAEQKAPSAIPDWDRLVTFDPILAERFATMFNPPAKGVKYVTESGRTFTQEEINDFLTDYTPAQVSAEFNKIVRTFNINERGRRAKVAMEEGRRTQEDQGDAAKYAERVMKWLRSRDGLSPEDKRALQVYFGDNNISLELAKLLDQYRQDPKQVPSVIRPAVKSAFDLLSDAIVPAETRQIEDWGKGVPPGAGRLFNKRLSDLVATSPKLEEVLLLIARASPNNRARQMAGMILRNANPDVRVSFATETTAAAHRAAHAKKKGNPNDLAAAFDPVRQSIDLLTNSDLEYYLVHEGSHAATLLAIRAGTPAGKALTEIYEAAKPQLGEAYGATNAEEFIADALSDDAFKERLRTLKAVELPGQPKTLTEKFKNLWEQIKEYISRIYSTIRGRPLSAEEKSLLDQVLELTPKLMRENSTLTQPGFEQMTAAALKLEGKFVESDYRPSVVDWAKKKWADTTAPDGTVVWQNFVQWFGDSKVVNEKGEPEVWYHGTAQDIKEFKPKQASSIFVTKSSRFAEDFTDLSEDFMAGKWRDFVPEDVAAKVFDQVRKENNAEKMDEAEFRRVYGDEIKLAMRDYLPSRANLMPLFVRAQNPFDYENWKHRSAVRQFLKAEKDPAVFGAMDDRIRKGDWGTIETPSVQTAIKQAGFDSYYVMEGGNKNLALYDPAQLKSASGNRGTFSAATGEIAAAEKRKGWEVAAPGKLDKTIYLLQDKQIDLKRVTEAIAKTGKDIADKWNAYLQEELFHGRSAKFTKDFLERELTPLLKQMQASNVSLAEMDDYLHARHAEEANRQVARVNPKKPDGGSGITTADAKKYIASLPPARRIALEAIAKKVDAITKGTRDMMVQYGLESADTIKKWEAAYKHYVPLFRADTEEGSLGIGQGYSIRGSESKRRVGSDREVVDVLANIAMQRERVITRGEKNRVGTALYGMVIQNPNEKFWAAINPNAADKAKLEQELLDMGLDPNDAKNIAANPREAVVDKTSNTVVYRVDPRLKDRDNVLVTRVNGEDRIVIFNLADDRAKRMASSLKNLDANQLGQAVSSMGSAGDYIKNFVGTVGKGTRYFASINTQYNPAFGIFNFIRDVGGATLNLSTTPLKGREVEVISRAVMLPIRIFSDLRAERAGKPANSEWGRLYEEFEAEGGKTGYRDMFENAQRRAENLQSELNKLGNDPKARLMRTFDFFKNGLSDFNDAIENSIRLSAYKSAKDIGMSNAQAASLAKNLTVNFNRKGAGSSSLTTLYAFFNASVQGSARIAETLSGPTGKKIVIGAGLVGVMQALLLAGFGYDEDEPPEFVKDRNFIIPLGERGKYVSIPMPLGFNVLPALTRRTVEMLRSDDRNVPKYLLGMLNVTLDGFNPMGSATLAQTIVPTLVDPVIALAENKDFAGRPIAKEDVSQLDPTPGYTRAKENASSIGKGLAYAINIASGGTPATQGALSPTPDQIDYLIGQATGGPGREVLKVVKTVESKKTGEELATYNVPMVGRLYGDVKQRAVETSRFYDTVKKMNEFQREFEYLAKEGKGDDFFDKHPEAVLYKASDQMYQEVLKLKKAKKVVQEQMPDDKQTLKDIDDAIFEVMASFNQLVRDTKAVR